MQIDFDKYDLENIYDMITLGHCTREDVARFYNNEWWDLDPGRCKVNTKGNR